MVKNSVIKNIKMKYNYRVLQELMKKRSGRGATFWTGKGRQKAYFKLELSPFY